MAHGRYGFTITTHLLEHAKSVNDGYIHKESVVETENPNVGQDGLRNDAMMRRLNAKHKAAMEQDVRYMPHLQLYLLLNAPEINDHPQLKTIVERERLYRSKIRVKNWNERNIIGSPVTLKTDNGELHSTFTSSLAFLSDCNEPVVFLKGFPGYYKLWGVCDD
jgi:hypothetical protein